MEISNETMKAKDSDGRIFIPMLGKQCGGVSIV